MMLSTAWNRSRANTTDSWYTERPLSRDASMDGPMRGLPSTILGMFKQDGLENVEEASDESDVALGPR